MHKSVPGYTKLNKAFLSLLDNQTQLAQQRSNTATNQLMLVSNKIKLQ